MSTPLSPQTIRAVAETAMQFGRRVRFAMRGSSMLPLLREPMILAVAPIARRVRRGDLLVFVQGGTQVVHRVVGFTGDDYVTSGDAQPRITERVARADVLGFVESVWADGSPTARRVDTRIHRLRGMWYARAHPARRRAAAVQARLRGKRGRLRGSLSRLGAALRIQRAKIHDASR